MGAQKAVERCETGEKPCVTESGPPRTRAIRSFHSFHRCLGVFRAWGRPDSGGVGRGLGKARRLVLRASQGQTPVAGSLPAPRRGSLLLRSHALRGLRPQAIRRGPRSTGCGVVTDADRLRTRALGGKSGRLGDPRLPRIQPEPSASQAWAQGYVEEGETLA